MTNMLQCYTRDMKKQILLPIVIICAGVLFIVSAKLIAIQPGLKTMDYTSSGYTECDGKIVTQGKTILDGNCIAVEGSLQPTKTGIALSTMHIAGIVLLPIGVVWLIVAATTAKRPPRQ